MRLEPIVVARARARRTIGGGIFCYGRCDRLPWLWGGEYYNLKIKYKYKNISCLIVIYIYI